MIEKRDYSCPQCGQMNEMGYPPDTDYWHGSCFVCGTVWWLDYETGEMREVKPYYGREAIERAREEDLRRGDDDESGLAESEDL